jgi:uncharacterized protein (DUF488 family)
MAETITIYTIGYGNRTIEEFLALLMCHGIQVVCDVRSGPYSSRFPEFSREPLSKILASNGIKYLFMGDVLGARPLDPDMYVNGRASYDAMRKSSAFNNGIERLEIGSEKYRVAIMCAEKDPFDCHRAILIGRRLEEDGIKVLHIDAVGQTETQSALEVRLLKHTNNQTSLFDSSQPSEVLAAAYAQRGFELSYDVDAAYARVKD